MGAAEKFRYDGKHAVVVGGASGMGKAVAAAVRELGATVTVLDVQPVTDVVDTYIQVDLRNETSIDAAIAATGGPAHALFSCAGVADGTPGLMAINFAGQRTIIERLVANGVLGSGAAIGAISSIGGFGWEKNLGLVNQLLATSGFDEALAWAAAHPDCDNYQFTKQAMNAYCAAQAAPLRAKGIRINSIAPGPTMTPLMYSNQGWMGFEQGFAAAMNRSGSTPEEQALPLLFLNSDAASFISGTVLTVDAGFVGGAITRTVGGPLVDAVLGRWLDPVEGA